MLRAVRGVLDAGVCPRVARSPWLRGFILGAAVFLAIGFVAGFGVALAIIDARLGQMERRIVPSERIYEHGEPVRR